MERASLRLLAFAAAAGWALCGCQQPQRAAQGGPPHRPKAEPSAAQPPSPQPGPTAQQGVPKAGGTGERTPAAAATPPNATGKPAPTKPFHIAPKGGDGWQPASLSAEDLGTKIDAATRALKGTKAESHLMVENAQLKGQISAQIQIQDRNLYRIEYQLPNRPTDTRLLVGKGGKRFSLAGEKWTPGPSQPAPSDDLKLVEQWPQSFSYRLFQPLESQANVWQRLLGSLAKGVGGYRTTVEQRTLPVDGRSVPFFRVLAEKGGAQPTTIEMRFEGNRFVPLVVKIVQKDAKGKPVNVQWEAGWSFGKTIDPKDVQIPGG